VRRGSHLGDVSDKPRMGTPRGVESSRVVYDEVTGLGIDMGAVTA
jgi:hypothetical protein